MTAEGRTEQGSDHVPHEFSPIRAVATGTGGNLPAHHHAAPMQQPPPHHASAASSPGGQQWSQEMPYSSSSIMPMIMNAPATLPQQHNGAAMQQHMNQGGYSPPGPQYDNQHQYQNDWAFPLPVAYPYAHNGAALTVPPPVGPAPDLSGSHVRPLIAPELLAQRIEEQRQRRAARKHMHIDPKRWIPAPVHEALMVLWLALPCVITASVPQVLIVTSQVFSGHVGTSELAAAALGNMWWTLMYTLIIGFSTALETLGSQAVGAGDTSSLVAWDFAAFIVMSLLCIPVGGALWNADAVARQLFGQTDAIAAMVQRYCQLLLPGLPLMVWAVVLQKHMQTQNAMLSPAVVSVATIAINVVLNRQYVQQYGFDGVPKAASVSRGFMFVSMLAAVMAHEGHRGTDWSHPNTWLRGVYRWQRAKRGKVLWTFVSLGLPGGIMMSLESASFEVTTAMAGYLGRVQVAAHASIFSLASLTFMAVPVAIALASSIRVGNLLGAGRPKQARLSGVIAILLGTTLASVAGGVMYLERDRIGYLFTEDDTAMVEMLASLAPLCALYQVANGIMGSSQGVLRGVGRQGQMLVYNALGFGFGITLGYWLTFGPHQMGLKGLWTGIVVGVSIVALLNMLTLLAVDWSEEVSQARQLLAMRQSSRNRRSMIAHALEEDAIADESLVEALLDEAQNDPRPLHIIYQDIFNSRPSDLAAYDPTRHYYSGLPLVGGAHPMFQRGTSLRLPGGTGGDVGGSAHGSVAAAAAMQEASQVEPGSLRRINSFTFGDNMTVPHLVRLASQDSGRARSPSQPGVNTSKPGVSSASPVASS